MSVHFVKNSQRFSTFYLRSFKLRVNDRRSRPGLKTMSKGDRQPMLPPIFPGVIEHRVESIWPIACGAPG